MLPSKQLKVVLFCKKITSMLDNSNGTSKKDLTRIKGNYLVSEEVIFKIFVCVASLLAVSGDFFTVSYFIFQYSMLFSLTDQ